MSESPNPARAVHVIEVYPGGPKLYLPPDWSQKRIDATVAMLRANVQTPEDTADAAPQRP